MLKDHISPISLHHAYLLVGDREAVKADLFSFLEKELEIKTKANPDFWLGEYDALSIEEGRVLKERQINKSFHGGKKIFVISANSINREAQNALLKMFEEPAPETHFFVILPRLSGLLPTLKSRFQLIEMSIGEETKSGKEFLALSKGERLTFLKEIIEEKDKEKAEEFLNGLEEALRKKGIEKENVRKSLEEIISMKQFLQDRGSSLKMILEHLALTLD